MATSIEIRATNAAFKSSAKTWIGHATGSDPKFGVALQFLGTRSGSTVTATVIEPGLYKTHSVTKKGAVDENYVLVWSLDGALVRTIISEAEAFGLAKTLTVDTINALGRQVEITDTEERLSNLAKKRDDEQIRINESTSELLGLANTWPLCTELRAAWTTFLERLRGLPAVAHVDAYHAEPPRGAGWIVVKYDEGRFNGSILGANFTEADARACAAALNERDRKSHEGK